jgi:hypothetical protein
MNGEPQAVSPAERTAFVSTPLPLPHEPDRPVLTVNTKGEVRTSSEEALTPLFTQHAMTDFRSRWDVIQSGFVDDPEGAVRAGNDLVAQIIKSLSESFSEQRSALEGGTKPTEQSSTENYRLAFRRYRSFFERLLSI